MSGPGDKLVTLVIDAKNMASGELKKLQSDLSGVGTNMDDVRARIGSLAGSAGYKSVVQGVGMGVGIQAWGMVKSAIGDVAGSIGDVFRAGMEEQANQARLQAALAANVAGWDGNTAAIQRGIDAGMNLGFTDDDITNSIARLIPITKDVAEAQRVMATAMDLARFKGIGLVDASLAIGKAMEGNKKMLKELGIDVKDAANAQQTLAAVQGAVAGQSAAYMDTMAGKMDAASARVDKARQDIGSWMVQMASQGLTGLDLATWDAAAHGYDDAALAKFRNGLIDVDTKAKAYADWLAKMGEAQATANALIGAGSSLLSDLGGSARTTGSELGSDLNPALGRASRVAQDAASAFASMQGKYDRMKSDLAAQSELRELPLRIAVAKDAVVAAQKDLQDARTSVDRHAAALRLQQAKDELAALQLQLSSNKATAAAYAAGQKFGDSLGRGLANAFASATGRLNVDVRSTVHARATAIGGPRSAGELLMVGEKGPELWVPQTNGTMVPNDRLPAVGSGRAVAIGSGAPAFTFAPTIVGTLSRSQVAQLADDLDAEFRRRYPRFSPYAARP